MRKLAIIALAAALWAGEASADDPQPAAVTGGTEVTSEDGYDVDARYAAYAIEGDWWSGSGEGDYAPIGPQNCVGGQCEEGCTFALAALRNTQTRPFSHFNWSVNTTCNDNNTATQVKHYCVGMLNGSYNLEYKGVQWSSFAWNPADVGETCAVTNPEGIWLEVDRRSYMISFCHSAYIVYNDGRQGPWIMGWHCHEDFGWMPKCDGNVQPQNICYPQ